MFPTNSIAMPSRRKVTKLIDLLSNLPSDGKYTLVRPLNYPPNSFYLITRTHFRFSDISDTTSAKGKEKETQLIHEGPGEGNGGGIKAAGKAWGMFYWRGACTSWHE